MSIADEPGGAQNGGARTSAEPGSVLIAEDDPIFRHLLVSWLNSWGYRVKVVENGLDAWNLLQQEDSPEVAILDWMMPGIDGAELCRRLRSETRGRYLYVLLVSAKGQKQDVVEGLDAGADDYLIKPFDAAELRARMRAGERILRLQQALLQARDALCFEAAHDALTGTWNHGAIMELLQKETQRHRRSGDPLGVMMADLDHFKKVNDTYGHPVGDSVLRECAHRMVATFRGYDSVGRYGGEEFLILVPGCNRLDLQASAERLRGSIAGTPVGTSAGPIPVTVSIGIAATECFPAGRPSYEELLGAADQALYLAKARGRNQVEAMPLAEAARR